MPGCVLASGVGQEGGAPGLVERGPHTDPVAEGIVDGLNTMVDTVTKKTCVLSIEDGILTIREA